jgi:signal transduction histidine kinase
MLDNTVSFKPKARLLLQLGDQLIRNEAIALFELVKNSYDANASYSKVYFENVHDPNSGKIVIEDDGDGMDLTTITDTWMQPGTDYKEKIFKEYQKNKNRKGRIPIGEKGIGRFGAYRLGNTIEVVTKKSSSPMEVYFEIDWSSIEQADFLEDVQVRVYERQPELFVSGKAGTRITITNLKQAWDRRLLRETVRLLNTLSTPSFIKNMDSFKVTVEENLGWTNGLLDTDEIIDYALFKGELTIKGDKIKSFLYSFTPWDSMKEMTARTFEDEDIPMKYEVKDETTRKKEFRTIDLSKYEIGEVKIIIFAYSLDTGILKLGFSDTSGFKKYLEQNGGMKVYRDGMRIYDYGEKSNDWLGLDIRRVNRPGNYLSNNQFIGYVLLNRVDSSDLIEKANREGFIENEAYFMFKQAVLFAVRQFEIQRNLDKEKLNNYYVTKRAKEPVVRRLVELKEKVEEKVKEKDVRDEIMLELTRIESEYNDMVDTFLKSANAGINLGVALHEIEKVIAELNNALSNTSTIIHARELAARLAELVKGYSLLLKGRDKGIHDIKGLVQQALFNVEFRLKAHEIKLETNIDRFGSIPVKCAKNITIGSIVNLIDNSIWWMSYRDIPDKKLYVGLSEEYSYHISVVVADNGPGFSIPPEDRIKPFISTKPTGTGMGLGLFIANQCMEDQGGELLFPDYTDFQIPEEYRNGAITVLAFRRDEK